MTRQSVRLIVVLGLDRRGTDTQGPWEDRALLELSEEMLEALRGDRRKPAPLDENFPETLRKRGFLTKAADWLREKAGNPTIVSMSDPRMTTLLPFWLEALRQSRIEVGYMLCISNPLDAAGSLAHDERFDLETGLESWIFRRLGELLATSSERHRVLVDCDQLRLDPVTQVSRIADRLNLGIDATQLKERVTEILDRAPRESRGITDDVTAHPVLEALARDVHSFLRRLASDEIDINAPEVSLRIEEFGAELRSVRPPAELQQARREIAQLTARLVSAERYRDTLYSAIADRRSTTKTLVDSAAIDPRLDTAVSALQAILAQDGAEFVRCAYVALLGREPDSVGGARYLARLCAGVPKLQILGELEQSAESRRLEVVIPGLRRAFALQKLERWPALGGLVAGLWGVERTAPSDNRLRAIQQLLHRISGKLDAYFLRIADELFLIRHRRVPESGHAQPPSSGRQALEPAAPAFSHRGPGPRTQSPAPAPPGSPVIFQFEYAATASPATRGESGDSRELALGIKTLQITEKSSGRTLCSIDFSDSGNAKDFILFGFGAMESWGAWSIGGKSAIIVWHDLPALGDLQVSMLATPYSSAFPALTCLLTSSAGHRRELSIEGGSLDFDLNIDAEGGANSAMFFGQPAPMATQYNVSLAETAPIVSVIILNLNNPRISYLSARAVLASSISVPFEIIIVDNGSSSDSYDILRTYGLPARVVRLPVNRYFGEGNNVGAEFARGEFLLFLNNDAFPKPGCIDALLEAFAARPDCGIAGPVFRYPDGRLQEAGGFIDPACHATQRGKFDLGFDVASLPEYEVVDYISAACLMIRANRFGDLGGFNYRYDPAYWEDADLCFRLLLRSERVILVRDAVCIHIENLTTSDQKNGDISANSTSARNRQVFLSSWDRYLKARSTSALPQDLIPAPRTDDFQATEEAVHAAFWHDPLGPPSGALRYVLAATLALSEFGPAALATPHAYSGMRLRNVLFDLGLAADRVSILPADKPLGRKLDRLLLTGKGIYPQFQLPAKRTFFCCQVPFPLGDRAKAELQLGMKILANCEKVIVGSEFAKRAYQRELERQRRCAIVEVVTPSVRTGRLLALERQNKPWIISIGRFSRSDYGKRQDVLIDAMKATSASFRRDWTLILCGDVPNSPADGAYLTELHNMVDHSVNVEFVLSPTYSQLEALLTQSSLFANACGFGILSAEDHWKCEQLGTEMIEALVAGCPVIGHRIGVAPEIIETVGSGSTFESLDELVSRLQACVVGGLDPNARSKAAQCYGDEAFTKRMIRAVS